MTSEDLLVVRGCYLLSSPESFQSENITMEKESPLNPPKYFIKRPGNRKTVRKMMQEYTFTRKSMNRLRPLSQPPPPLPSPPLPPITRFQKTPKPRIDHEKPSYTSQLTKLRLRHISQVCPNTLFLLKNSRLLIYIINQRNTHTETTLIG